MIHLSKNKFGVDDKQVKVFLFILKNKNGVEVKITNYGGIITEINVPDKNGKFENICLGFDSYQQYRSPAYLKAMPYFGAIIGRYTNRIANGSFTINGEVYKLTKNNAGNTLHGGAEGFDKKFWEAKTQNENDAARLMLTYKSRDGEEGFPGNLDMKVVYTLNNQNELKIHYRAITDKPTHVNFTNHSYFNLNACKQNILKHSVRISADYYSEVNKQNIPTGKSIAVAGTCMDFTQLQQIGERIDEVEGNGYDHNYELNNYDNNLRFAAEAIDHESGRKLEVYTTEPGMQFYTANHLNGSLSNKGCKYTRNMGFCFETQHFPDSPNQPSFPPTLLNPGEVFQSETIYRFSVEG